MVPDSVWNMEAEKHWSGNISSSASHFSLTENYLTKCLYRMLNLTAATALLQMSIYIAVSKVHLKIKVIFKCAELTFPRQYGLKFWSNSLIFWGDIQENKMGFFVNIVYIFLLCSYVLKYFRKLVILLMDY